MLSFTFSWNFQKSEETQHVCCTLLTVYLWFDVEVILQCNQITVDVITKTTALNCRCLSTISTVDEWKGDIGTNENQQQSYRQYQYLLSHGKQLVCSRTSIYVWWKNSTQRDPIVAIKVRVIYSFIYLRRAKRVSASAKGNNLRTTGSNRVNRLIEYLSLHRLVKEKTFKQKDANGKKISDATLNPWHFKNQHPLSKQSVGSLPNLYFTDMWLGVIRRLVILLYILSGCRCVTTRFKVWWRLYWVQ